MRIEIDLPEWADDRPLIILSGQELVAKYTQETGWKVKAERCYKCGECCCDIAPDHLPFGVTGDGKCKMLLSDGSCGAGHQKPFACLDDPVESEFAFLGCSIRYKR